MVITVDNQPPSAPDIEPLATEHISEMIPSVTRAVVTYGLHEDADIRAENLRQSGRMMHFDVFLPNQAESMPVSLNLPGEHNVANSLAAVAVALELGPVFRQHIRLDHRRVIF